MGNPNQIIKLSSKNIVEGVIEEPRVYFDSINILASQVASPGAPDVFRNGEQFPVTITHLVTAMNYLDAASPAAVQDERLIQRSGLRLTFHDQYYMNREFISAAAWPTKPVAANDVITRATSSWKFVKPFILSARDSLKVDVQLYAVPGEESGSRIVTVSFTGIGIQSQQTYFFAADLEITDDNIHTLATDRFRNDGAEPIFITDMNACISSNSEDLQDTSGDIRLLKLNVTQIGNGTNALWGIGPVTGGGNPNLFPATLIGQNVGRAVVHEFPSPLIWEPGEGITIEAAETFFDALEDAVVDVALLGYIAIV